MMSALVKYLLNFKHAEEAEGNDFEGDLVRLYSELRMSMSSDFLVEDFGPPKIVFMETDNMSKDEINAYRKKIKIDEDRKKKGYNRIREKVMSLRSDYRKAIDSGRRSKKRAAVEPEDGFDSLQAQCQGGPSSSGSTSRNEEFSTTSFIDDHEEADEPEEDLIYEDISDLRKKKFDGDLQQKKRTRQK